MPGTLNVSNLPQNRSYECRNGTVIDLASLLAKFQPAVATMSATGLVEANDSFSFGFAMAAPQFDHASYELDKIWDEPERFVWFVGGWGPDRERYTANAVCKMRPVLREDRGSTLDLRFNEPSAFRDIVDPVADKNGLFPWGDFPWGGAVVARTGSLVLVGACSGLTETQDDFVTELILGALADQIIAGDGLLSDS